MSPISDDEILEAVNGIGALKAPGPNGLNVDFFQKCWELVKDLVMCMIKDFFQNRSNLCLINHTKIALTPKIDNPKMVCNYRPISLCDVSYEIITKIIIKRVKPPLNFCISQNQGTFAPGRAIQVNILIAHEKFARFNRMKG